MIRHTFPAATVAMDPYQIDLTNMTAEQALAEIDRAHDIAWMVLSDFRAKLNDAEALVRNTGSIHGNAVAFPVAGESDTLCRCCTGSGLWPRYDADTETTIHQTCHECGGSGFGGPVVVAGIAAE